ncbi:MAG: HD domain-containing protein [Clostridiales bacterium]|nr:HD domain-containing protein [Clostridiales bacterium]
MDFILELDRLKQIQRQTYITGDQRKENDAEHSWHLAVMSIILSDYAEVPLDLTKVLTMVLIHDVVEIDAGDTYAYDEEGNATKRQREEAAANRLFGILPRPQAESMRAVWEEFEKKETPEAKFANTMDRVQPILLNDATNGDAWKEHKVTAAQILNRNRSTWEGAPQVWKYAETLIHKHIQNGDIQEDRR